VVAASSLPGKPKSELLAPVRKSRVSLASCHARARYRCRSSAAYTAAASADDKDDDHGDDDDEEDDNDEAAPAGEDDRSKLWCH
jgi:hypothetical protein